MQDAEKDNHDDLAEPLLVSGNPPPRINNMESRPETHLPHQKTFSACALDAWKQYLGGRCADSMGMGKSRQIVTPILAMEFTYRVKNQEGANECLMLIVSQLLVPFEAVSSLAATVSPFHGSPT